MVGPAATRWLGGFFQQHTAVGPIMHAPIPVPISRQELLQT
jgi:hypothetical protein